MREEMKQAVGQSQDRINELLERSNIVSSYRTFARKEGTGPLITTLVKPEKHLDPTVFSDASPVKKRDGREESWIFLSSKKRAVS
jgi:hypothetical protein